MQTRATHREPGGLLPQPRGSSPSLGLCPPLCGMQSGHLPEAFPTRSSYPSPQPGTSREPPRPTSFSRLTGIYGAPAVCPAYSGRSETRARGPARQVGFGKAAGSAERYSAAPMSQAKGPCWGPASWLPHPRPLRTRASWLVALPLLHGGQLRDQAPSLLTRLGTMPGAVPRTCVRETGAEQ